MDALAEHLTAGRISLDEYGDRSARVTVAKTAGDLDALFDDLPQPHPVAPAAVQVRGPNAPSAPAPRGALGSRSTDPAAAAADSRSTAQKLVAAAAAVSVFVALALFFTTGSWLWFLLIPGISGVASAIWGPDWREAGDANRRRIDRDRSRRIDRDRRRRGELGR